MRSFSLNGCAITTKGVPTSQAETVRRPFGIMLVAVLIGFSAVLNITFGILMILAIFGTNPTRTDPLGNDYVIGGGWLLVNGIITLILGLMYPWLLTITKIGSATAQVIIRMLVVINIVFAIFNLPYGWWTIFISMITLIMVGSAKATMWFRETN